MRPLWWIWVMLSTPEGLPSRLHWVAILHGGVSADLGITGGVQCASDVARVAFMASALMKHGVRHADHVLAELDHWLDAHEYASIAEMCGYMSYAAVPDTNAYERGNYMKVLSS